MSDNPTETPDNGEIRIGDTAKLGYVDQEHDTIDPEKPSY